MGNRQRAKMILLIVFCMSLIGAGYGLVHMLAPSDWGDRIFVRSVIMFMPIFGRNEPGNCISQQMMTNPDLAGVKVEVVYTNCDTFAKDESVKVYFARAGVKGVSWFARWRRHTTLVFWYDPGGRAKTPLPTITSTSPSTILISTPVARDVLYESRTWEEVSINYA